MSIPSTSTGLRRDLAWRPSPLLPVDPPHIDAPTDPAPDPAPPAITVVTPPAPAPTPRTFSAEDIERARAQEKDKLYPDIEAARREAAEARAAVERLTNERQAEIDAAAAKAREEAEEAARKRFEEMDASGKVAELQQTWEEKFAQMQQERDRDRATFEREREFTALGEYARSSVATAVANNEIAPELADLVTGNTKDEIDASLNVIKGKSAEIAASVAAALGQQPAPAPVQQRGVAPTGYSATGPMDNEPGTRTLTPDDIRNMPMTEYAKYRGQLLPGASAARQNQGMFA